jgi:hypothetical protein
VSIIQQSQGYKTGPKRTNGERSEDISAEPLGQKKTEINEGIFGSINIRQKGNAMIQCSRHLYILRYSMVCYCRLRECRAQVTRAGSKGERRRERGREREREREGGNSRRPTSQNAEF